MLEGALDPVEFKAPPASADDGHHVETDAVWRVPGAAEPDLSQLDELSPLMRSHRIGRTARIPAGRGSNLHKDEAIAIGRDEIYLAYGAAPIARHDAQPTTTQVPGSLSLP